MRKLIIDFSGDGEGDRVIRVGDAYLRDDGWVVIKEGDYKGLIKTERVLAIYDEDLPAFIDEEMI